MKTLAEAWLLCVTTPESVFFFVFVGGGGEGLIGCHGKSRDSVSLWIQDPRYS